MTRDGRRYALPDRVGPAHMPPGAKPAWSRATSYKRCEVGFMVQGGRASAGRLPAGRDNPQQRGNTMELRTRIAGGATAVAMVGLFGLAAATPASAAPPVAQTTVAQLAADLPVTGTLADGTPFVGQL